jgi:hypothetical protein
MGDPRILVLLMLASTALYGPQAAALVELFPTQVRYTALSVPYNIGVGWVGGLLPVSAFALVAARGDINAGLLYPLVFTLLSIVCALLFLPRPGRAAGRGRAAVHQGFQESRAMSQFTRPTRRQMLLGLSALAAVPSSG